MPQDAFDLACPFATPSAFDGWLPAIPFRNHVGRLSWRRPRGPLEAYLVGTAFVAAATLARLAVDPLVVGSQFATYFLAVVCSTLSGGICVGLFSIAMSLVPAWYFFLAPDYNGLSGGEAYSVLAFVLVAAPIVYVVGLLQNAGAVIQDARLRAAIAEERARTADELQRWKNIFDNIAVGIAVSDPESNTLRFANPAYAAMHGLTSAAVEGLSIFNTYAPHEREHIAELGAAVDVQGIIDFEACHVRADGSTFPAKVHITSVSRTDGVSPYRIVTVTDITAEREFQTRLTDVFDNAAIGMSIVDPVTNVVRFANPAFAAAHGMSVYEAQGKSVFQFYPAADHARIANLKAAADRDGVIDYEAENIRKDGSVFFARTQVTSVRSQDGKVRYRIATLQDISCEKQLQAQLRQAQRLEAIGQLCAGVAHDFNNLLQGIISHLEMADEDIDLPDTHENISSAIRLAEQAGSLAQQLLSFGRKQLLVSQEIDLHDFLEQFVHLLARTLDPRIRVQLKVAERIQTLWADPTHLRSALLNLAINARDAMPSGGSLILDVAYGDPSNDTLIFRTIDTGCGIADTDLHRVCEPFFSTKGLNGTGLGLSMVHGFAKQSGGDLHISSKVGQGTCVELVLPAHLDRAKAAA